MNDRRLIVDGAVHTADSLERRNRQAVNRKPWRVYRIADGVIMAGYDHRSIAEASLRDVWGEGYELRGPGQKGPA